jgi:dTDP-4-dehydrorhamnose reductase
MRISILGANGQLGRDLTRALAGHELQPLTRRDTDVTEHAKTRGLLASFRPELIVNLTAYHRVDDCEDHVEEAYGVNAFAVLNLVRTANDLGAAIAHVSTDYVFDGASRSPYVESSAPAPLSIYGNSKLAGEYLVRTQARQYFLIRTGGLYGHAGSRGRGGNFVETMLKKARAGEAIHVVDDQTITPTHTADLAKQMALLLATPHHGLFHITNEGQCTWYEFAKAIFEIAGIAANLSPTTSDLYKLPAIRPRYSVLENARLKALGLNRMQHWRDALTEYLR